MASNDEFQQRQFFEDKKEFKPIIKPFWWRDTVKITGDTESEILWFEVEGRKFWGFKKENN